MVNLKVKEYTAMLCIGNEPQLESLVKQHNES